MARDSQKIQSVRGRSTFNETSRAAAAPSQVMPTAVRAAGARLASAHPPRAAYVPPSPALVSARPRPVVGGRSSAVANLTGITTPATPDAISAALLIRPASMRER
jgi:hypothetical protein